MNTLLSYLMINVYTENFQHFSRIQAVTETYLQSVQSAALISNDLPSWKDVKFSFPLEIRTLENVTEPTSCVAAFILDLRQREWSPEYISPLTRNANSKFVIITDQKDVKVVSEPVIRFGLCHVMVVSIHNDDIKVTQLKDPCRGIGGQPEKALSCKANVSFFDYPPDIIFTGSKLSGTEGRMVQTVLDHFGFNVSYVNRHETFFGDYDPPTGLNGDIVSGRSIVGLGVLYALYDRWVHTDMIFGCGYTQLCWAVPAGAAPRQPTWSVILISELSSTVWLCLSAAYLALIPVAIVVNWELKRGIEWPFHILALILGIPQQLILRRSFTLAIVLFGFLLAAHYQAMMGSKLTKPAKVPEISTLKQLADSGLYLSGPPVVGIFLNLSSIADPGNAAKFQISSRYEPTLQELDELLPRITEHRDSAYLRHRTFVYNHVLKNPRTKGRIHMVEEPSLEFIPGTMLAKHSCLTRNFQNIYHRLCESGLGSKWIQEATPKETLEDQEGPRKLAVEHIQGFLYLLLFGWLISFLTFIAEILADIFKIRFKIRGRDQNLTQILPRR